MIGESEKAQTMKLNLDDDTIVRAHRAKEALTRARCWHDGYKAAGGHFLWSDCLIDAQVICDRIMQAADKIKTSVKP